VKALDKTFRDRIRQAEAKEKGVKLELEMESETEIKERLPFDQFTALDIRVGNILEVGPIKGSDKLLKLIIDIGSETRQVVAV